MSKRIVLLQALATVPNELAVLLTTVGSANGYTRSDADAWSLADVVQHLLLVEGKFQQRLRRVMAEERPFLPTIHPSASEHTRTDPLTHLVAEFAHLREETVTYLTSLKAGSWQKTAVHETEGPVTFTFLVQMIIDHDRDHLNQLHTLQENLATHSPISNPQS
jgi:uncharacterized damage-inducible protein DinB